MANAKTNEPKPEVTSPLGIAATGQEIFDAPTDIQYGLMSQAMAWKVMYRKPNGINDNQFERTIPWDNIAAHPDNRGKTYPTESRVKDLFTSCIRIGFNKDEAQHMATVVEADPSMAPGPDGVPKLRHFTEYNLSHVKGSPGMEPMVPQDSLVMYAFLNHTHMGMGIKAARGKAPWHEQPISLVNKTELPICDKEGKLDIELLKDHPNSQLSWI